MNSFGDKFRFTSFGESHGRAIGGVLDGVPAGLSIDIDMIHDELDRRAGRIAAIGHATSTRAQHEQDEIEWLSGVMDGKTLGTPIAFIIRNTDARPEDYEWLRTHFRPGHADWVYEKKYGIRDWRGGGRASARETISRVVVGCIAKQLLLAKGIRIHAQVTQIGMETDSTKWETLLEEVRRAGDSIGGIVTCTISGVPVGVGEPIFDKLQSHLAYAMMTINGCKGFDYGCGFSELDQRGSEQYTHCTAESCPASGGIDGGISNGQDIVFRCAFKPTATIGQLYKGRHDVCIALRAAAVVEAMAALVLINETL